VERRGEQKKEKEKTGVGCIVPFLDRLGGAGCLLVSLPCFLSRYPLSALVVFVVFFFSSSSFSGLIFSSFLVGQERSMHLGFGSVRFDAWVSSCCLV